MSKDTIHLFNNLAVKGLVANGVIGSGGQALLSNGTGVYWGSGAGFTGSKGDKGESGEFGGASFFYRWDTDTFVENIDDGFVLLNNTNLTLATVMGISTVDRNDTDLSAFIQTIDDSTSDIKATVKITEQANVANFIIYSVVATHTDHFNHFDVPISYVSGSLTSLANGSNIAVSFVVVGNRGDLGYTGSRGFTGSQGIIGFTGSRGIIGFTGSKGDIGFTGSASTVVGYTGSKGDIGFTGSASTVIGYTGSKGDIGFTGSRGITGFTGSASTVVGYTGSKGDKGDKGDTGFTGSASTVVGFTGSKGDKGDIGFTGSKGDKGDTGFTGSRGAQGPTGFTGSKGDKGDIGFTGSKGDKGDIGFTGSKGDKGDIGFTGSRGAQGPTGFTGSQGAQGPTGFTGSQGAQGPTGFTGSKGDKGDIGFTGSRGAQGPTGFTGSKGDKGDIGFTGSKGDKGDIGFTGSKGDKGDIGFTGSRGDKGDIGFTGSRGAQGATGPQGPVGFTGSQGQITYTLADTGGSASWIKLGTLTTTQDGRNCFISISAGAGYNADSAQNQYTELYFRTSNNASNQGGFYGSANAIRYTALGTSTFAPSVIRIVQVNNGSYEFFGSFGAFTGFGSFYTVNLAPGQSWTNSSTLVSTPSGTLLEVTPSVQIGFTGSQGNTVQGPQGSIGFTGSRGDTGAQGPQGSIGFTGSKGDTGAQGPQGPIGFTGSQGNTVQGPTGPQGPAGPASLPQNPTGTTYGDGVSTVPTYMLSQAVGDNDGWRLYGEAPATNQVRMVFELVDDIEDALADQWAFRNKRTYTDFVARNEFFISGTGYSQSRVSSRAPIFYDSANTQFYGDFAGTSNLAGVDINLIARIITDSIDTGNTTNGLIFDGNYINGQYRHRFRKQDNGGGVPLYLDYAAATANSYDALMKFGPNTADGSYLTVYGTVATNTDMRAPIFYDSANTQFYGDFAGTSVLNTLRASSYFTSGSGVGRGLNPGGGQRGNNGSSETGALKITLPQSWTSTMLRFTVKVYDYNTNTSFDVSCGGYNWGGESWVNTFGYIVGNPNVDRNFNIRFGHDGSRACVFIGELNSVWSYVQVAITDVQVGFSGFTADAWEDDWAISIVTSFPTLSGTTISNAQVGRYGTIFYDSDNTGYYIDPAGTSNLNGLTVASTITGNITGSALRIVFNDGPRDLSDRLPNTFTRTVNWDFVGAAAGNAAGNYAGVMTFAPWTGTTASTGDSSYQLAFGNQSGVNASGPPRLSIRSGIDTTWGAWYIVLTSANYNSYSPTLTGGGASGSWGISVTGTAGSISGFNNPTTAPTESTIAYRDAAGDIAAREIILSSGLSAETPTVLTSMYPTTNQLVRTTPGAVATAIRGAASGSWGINITGSAASAAGCTFTDDSVNRADITTRLDSGFYEHDTVTTAEGWPYNGSWMHMIAATHSNNGNYFSMQIAADFFSNNPFYRSVNNSGTAAWSRFALYGNNYGSTLYATQFIDSNNTERYVDPDGTSVLNTVSLGAQTWRNDITWNNAVNILVPASAECSFDVATGGVWQVWDTPTGAPMIKAAAGTNVAIGEAGSRGLYVYGAITASDNITAYSDVRIKRDIYTIENALEKTLALRGVTYYRTDDRIKEEDKDKRKIGVVAQEVEAILPEVVREDADGIKSVDYGNIVGLLIEAIKEQQTSINKLQQEIISLKEDK